MLQGFLIPPRSVTVQDGSLLLARSPALAADHADDAGALDFLRSDLTARQSPLEAGAQSAPGGSARVCAVRDSSIRGHDAYILKIAPKGAVLRASTAAGIHCGIQTLRELVRMYGLRLPACVIRDRSDFARRGVYLDCSRGKVPTVETLKLLVEQLAAWKINELQLYVENVFTFRRHPEIGRGFSPFTPGELLAVRDHCRLHHVRFVPSLSSFGHFERTLHLPPYAPLGELPGYRGFRGGTTLCPQDSRAIRLVADLYAEFLPLFDAEDFNACCDETWELGKGRSADRAKTRGAGRVYLDFILKLHKLCRRHGKRMNIWADILLNHADLVAEVPDDIVLLNWEYEPAGPRIARTRLLADAGRAFVVCPGTSGWQTHGSKLNTAMANVAAFAAEGRQRGAEGLLNTDWGDWGHRNLLGASLHGLAHGAAHAWNGRKVNDKQFTDIFCRHVFGPSGAGLAPFLRTLGSATERTGTLLYHAFAEPLLDGANLWRGISRISPVCVPAPLRRAWSESANEQAMEDVIAELTKTDSRTLPSGEMDSFAQLACSDLALAARMDVAACRRVLAGRRLRSGRRVDRRALRSLGDEVWSLREPLESAWLARNKPSRLRDNLRLLANSADELWSLSRKS
jgi:hexosaminidase